MYINPTAVLAFMSGLMRTPVSDTHDQVQVGGLVVDLPNEQAPLESEGSHYHRITRPKHQHDQLRRRDVTIWKTETIQYTIPAAKAKTADVVYVPPITTMATQTQAQATTSSVPAPAAATSSQAAIASGSGPKKVFAHFMMGNSYPMSVADFAANIQSALAIGIDGFALNVGPDDWMSDRVNKMYQAAIGTNFKLFISLDMAVMASSSISQLSTWVTNYASHPNQYFYNSKQFVSTFAGEGTTFGMSDATAGWNAFKSSLAGQGHPIFFVPSFTALGPAGASGMSSNDGTFSWDAWPTTDSEMTTAEDQAYMNARNGKVYMAGVSPWFFTHFSYKNWVYKSDDLLTTRWEQLVSLQPDFIEIVTWNDYGESSYIGQISGATPYDGEINSSSWTYGYDHTAWAGLCAYYIQAYKNAAYPAVTSNNLYWWYRSHPKTATATSDPYGKPTNYDWADDNIYLTLLLTGPAVVTVTSGGSSQTFNGVAGKNHFQYVGFSAGTPSVSVSMGGATVLSASGPMAITNSPAIYNFNPVAASESF